MEKKSFWTGFITGNVIFIITAVVLYFNFMIQPDLSLSQVETQDLNGNIVNLENYIGKPLVVNYWATWCAPCRAEFPEFEKIKQQYGEEVNFIMISDEPIDKITKFSKSNPYTFNYLKSSKDLSSYGINTRPTTYFYNAKGILVAKETASLDAAKLNEMIKKVK
jgi:thiol-disulfide isomerase/thioredoxin